MVAVAIVFLKQIRISVASIFLFNSPLSYLAIYLFTKGDSGEHEKNSEEWNLHFFFDIDRLKQPHKHLLPAVRMLIIPREAHIVRGEVNSHPAIMSLAFHERLWHEVGEADTLLLRSRLREMSSASDGVLNGLLGIYWQASLLPLLSVEQDDLTFCRQELFIYDFLGLSQVQDCCWILRFVRKREFSLLHTSIVLFCVVAAL